MIKVKLLEAISPYSKCDIIDMREDLVRGIFKDKVEIMNDIKDNKEEKDLFRMNKIELLNVVEKLGIKWVAEDKTKTQILNTIHKYIEDNEKDDKSMEWSEKENKGVLSKLIWK